MQIFGKNDLGNLDHHKSLSTITHENLQNRGFTCFRARLTLKMERFDRGDQPTP